MEKKKEEERESQRAKAPRLNKNNNVLTDEMASQLNRQRTAGGQGVETMTERSTPP